MKTMYAASYDTDDFTGHIAIVGGTGFEVLPPEIFAESMDVKTRFGVARVLSVSNNYVEPYKLYFLARHGATHGLAPHQINYRANIAALHQLGVRYVYATNAVGSLRATLTPGSLVLMSDFIDFTRSRPLTYYGQEENGQEETWSHVDFSTPYSDLLRATVLRAATDMGVNVVPTATYLCCDGPRFESPAEVRLFGQWGADVVGMTGLPEAIFAREAGIEYAALGIVTNLGAGLTQQKVEHQKVTAVMNEILPKVRELMLSAATHLMDAHTKTTQSDN